MSTDQVTVETVFSCGHKPKATDLPREGFGASGYATITTTGARVCYDCAAEMYRAVARRGVPLTGYVSQGNAVWSITTWTGHVLGTVTRVRKYGRHPTMYAIQATIEGRAYHGRGQGPGMCINLRPSKP